MIGNITEMGFFNNIRLASGDQRQRQLCPGGGDRGDGRESVFFFAADAQGDILRSTVRPGTQPGWINPLG
jgi:hypothetical protein